MPPIHIFVSKFFTWEEEKLAKEKIGNKRLRYTIFNRFDQSHEEKMGLRNVYATYFEPVEMSTKGAIICLE